MSDRISMQNGITVKTKRPSTKKDITRGQSTLQDSRMSNINSTSRKITFQEEENERTPTYANRASEMDIRSTSAHKISFKGD